jgi:hypothetical protein
LDGRIAHEMKLNRDYYDLEELKNRYETILSRRFPEIRLPLPEQVSRYTNDFRYTNEEGKLIPELVYIGLFYQKWTFLSI